MCKCGGWLVVLPKHPKTLSQRSADHYARLLQEFFHVDLEATNQMHMWGEEAVRANTLDINAPFRLVAPLD